MIWMTFIYSYIYNRSLESQHSKWGVQLNTVLRPNCTRWPVHIKVLHCLNHVAWFKQCDPVLASNLRKPRYLGFTSLHCLNHVASTNRKPGLTKVPGLGRFGFSYICVQILKFGGILQFLWFELKTTNQWMTDQGMWRAAGTAKNCARGLL